jgi:serine protease Do
MRSNTNTEERTGKIGVRVDTLNDDLRQRLELPSKQKGAVVLDVDNGSVAQEAGLMPGDVVTEVNGSAITDAKGFVKAIDKAPAGKLVKMLVVRQGATTFMGFLKP